MIILGINDSHDASACLMQDGKLLIAQSEERTQRIKSTGGFPFSAIQACLKYTGITGDEIDSIAVASETLVPNNLWNCSTTFTVSDYWRMHEQYYYPILFENKKVKFTDGFPDYQHKGDLVYPLEKIPFATSSELSSSEMEAIQKIRHEFIAEYFEMEQEQIHFINHHKCHAYYAYYVSPEKKDNMTIVTADSGGDGAYTSISVVADSKIREIWSDRTNLLGKIYTSITLQLGMRPDEHEYKVMGLAPYASEFNKSGPREVFMESLKVRGLSFEKNPEMNDFFFYFLDKLKMFRFDGIAGGLQDFVEARLEEWFLNIAEKTGSSDFIFSGGIANNVKANKKLIELDCVNSFFVPPGPGDESLSIGAAYSLSNDLVSQQRGSIKEQSFLSAYWGEESDQVAYDAFTNHEYVQENFIVYRQASLDIVAQHLADGEIVGMCTGAMEFGSRALGHRSLLADPSRNDSVRKINDLIKKRDFWMPFTPSVLDENYDEYVVNPKNISSNFMTITFDSTEIGRKHLQAACHPYDYTVRPQRVTEETCPVYHELIAAFKNLTGIGALLNTSLNIHGKPIINHPLDILNEILIPHDIPLNHLYIGNDFYIRKNR